MKAPYTYTHLDVPFEVYPPTFADDKWMGFVWRDGHIVRVEFDDTREQVIWKCEAWINGKAQAA